jgi:hypothetical protein
MTNDKNIATVSTDSKLDVRGIQALDLTHDAVADGLYQRERELLKETVTPENLLEKVSDALAHNKGSFEYSFGKVILNPYSEDALILKEALMSRPIVKDAYFAVHYGEEGREGGADYWSYCSPQSILRVRLDERVLHKDPVVEKCSWLSEAKGKLLTVFRKPIALPALESLEPTDRQKRLKEKFEQAANIITQAIPKIEGVDVDLSGLEKSLEQVNKALSLDRYHVRLEPLMSAGEDLRILSQSFTKIMDTLDIKPKKITNKEKNILLSSFSDVVGEIDIAVDEAVSSITESAMIDAEVLKIRLGSAKLHRSL